MIYLIGIGSLALGGVLGWFLSRLWDRGPEGWVVLFPSLGEAALAWRPGSRVYYLDRDGLHDLSEKEINSSLAARLDGNRHER